MDGQLSPSSSTTTSTTTTTAFLPVPPLYSTLRTSPTAPPPLPSIAHPLIRLLLLPSWFFLILPFQLLATTLRHLLIGPKFKGWKLKTAIANRILKGLLFVTSSFGLPAVDPNAAKVLNAKKYGSESNVMALNIPSIKPESELMFGWLKHPSVKPAEEGVPGFMISPKIGKGGIGKGLEKAKEGEKIIMYFVGGGFVVGHPLQLSTAWGISKLLNIRVFCPNYRKSLTPSTSFPAAHIDALSSYIYLLKTLGFKPKDVVLMGDSAGGNLALGLGRVLGEVREKGLKEGEGLGMPGGMILFSPWVDMTSSSPSSTANGKYDYAGPIAKFAIPSHTRNFPEHISMPYFSPALPAPSTSSTKSNSDVAKKSNGSTGSRFEHLKDTKIYMQTGTAECLYDEDRWLCEGMKADGVDVWMRVLEGDVHVGIVFGRKKAVGAAEKDLPEFFAKLK